MTEATKGQNSIVYLDARPQDVESLKTIIPRAFFRVNEFMKSLFPDTPAMRAWWGGIFEDYISNPGRHVPVAVDTSTNVVVGAMLFRGVRQGEPFGGFTADHTAIEDHNAEVWSSAMKDFAADERRHAGDRDRFLIEVMGVDHAYQGMGIGRQLVANACKLADSEGYMIFLETTQAKHFYLKQGLGFKVVETKGEEDRSGVLIREPGGGTE